eukprot:RCo005987
MISLSPTVVGDASGQPSSASLTSAESSSGNSLETGELENLSEAMARLYHQSVPSEDSKRTVLRIIETVQRVVWRIFHPTEADKRRYRNGEPTLTAVQVRLYGSKLWGVSSEDGDVDMTLTGGFFDKPDFNATHWQTTSVGKCQKLCMFLACMLHLPASSFDNCPDLVLTFFLFS